MMNKRNDEYRRRRENELRAARILEGIKAECGQDYPVSMRLGLKTFIQGFWQGKAFLVKTKMGRTIEEGVKIARLLESYSYGWHERRYRHI